MNHSKALTCLFLLALACVIGVLVLGGASSNVWGLVFCALLLLLILTGVLVYRYLKQVEHSKQQLTFELKQAKVALNNLREQQEKGLSQKHFYATANHDLRQPLHTLGLYVGALGSHVTTPDAQHILNCATESIDSLSNHLASVLEVSKLDAGMIVPKPTEFEITPLVRRLYQQFLPLAKQKGLELECSESSSTVFTDEKLLEKIMCQLLSNAITYTENGLIKIECTDAGSNVHLSVSDTGCGIDGLLHEVIFNDFHREQNQTASRNQVLGLGLGLSIVRRIANLLQLRVKVSSEPHTGSEFSIVLPAVVDKVKPDSGGANRVTYSGAAENRIKVLVVDDDQYVLEGTKALLETHHFQVLVATDGESSLAVCTDAALCPDVILCDYRLNEKESGIDVILAVREAINKIIPAILLTGDSTVNVDKLKKIENLKVLYKPVDASQLLAQLRE